MQFARVPILRRLSCLLDLSRILDSMMWGHKTLKVLRASDELDLVHNFQRLHCHTLRNPGLHETVYIAFSNV